MKCHNCSIKLVHGFGECLSVDCQCPCVRQIYLMPTNNHESDVASYQPKFLKMDNVEVKNLPNQDKEIKEFNAIRKEEWLPKKKDKRRKKKR